MSFKPFHFDCNSGFGLITSPRHWRWLVSNTNANYSVPELLRGRICDPSSDVPEDVPHFGFRIEHQGARTLSEWAHDQGMDLLADALAPGLGEELRRRGIAVGPFLARYHAFRREVVLLVERYKDRLMPFLLDALADGGRGTSFPDLSAWSEYDLFVPQLVQEQADKEYPS